MTAEGAPRDGGSRKAAWGAALLVVFAATWGIWSIGPLDDDEGLYAEIARAKAFASWRTGVPMDALVQSMPYMLQANEDESDTLFSGSAVLFGITVGASGVQSYFDELAAYMVTAACRALCIQIMQEKFLPEGEKDRCFLWERTLDSEDNGDR